MKADARNNWNRSWYPEKSVIRGLRIVFNWLFSWKIIRGTFVGLAIVITLFALFYAIENWRGKHAWEVYKTAAVARGDELNLASLLPPRVPDDANVMKAPKMEEWLYQRTIEEFPVVGSRSTSSRPWIIPIPSTWFRSGTNQSVRLLRELSRRRHPVIDLKDLPKSARLDESHSLLEFNGFKFWEDFFAWVARETGLAMRVDVPSLDFPRIVLPRDRLDRFPFFRWTNMSFRQVIGDALDAGTLELRVDPQNLNGWLVSNRATSPEGMLEILKKYDADFNALHAALQRPKVEFDCHSSDHSEDRRCFSLAASHGLAKALQVRAQVRMALGDIGGAWIDLQDLRRLADLTDKQPTLIAAIIRVNLYGPYLRSIEEGIRLDLWSESQLRQLESELPMVDLIGSVKLGLQGERASLVALLGQDKPTIEAQTLLDNLAWWGGRQPAKWMPAFLQYAPAGWRYQNLVNLCMQRTKEIDVLKIPGHQIRPADLQRVATEVHAGLRSLGPYNFLNRYVAPNFSGAVTLAALCQSAVDLTTLASSLQRYRKENGNYPEELSALVPKYLATLPKDICTGDLPKYRREANGTFLLYSVGFNLTDDGGSSVRDGGLPKDWVWGK